MWSDIESKIDFLNYSEASEIIINVLQNPQMLPISIGVFGSWGTGKSTILNLIENNLEHIENHDDYVIIRFEAWLYQGFDDARASLLEVINTEISKLIEEQYQRAIHILETNKEKLTQLADILIEKEVIFKDDLETIFGKRPFDKEEEIPAAE